MRLRIAYINNKRAMAYCPFHEDKRPSFEIKLEGDYYGEYFCFSCGRTGTLTKQIMEQIVSKAHKGKKDQRPNNIDWSSLVEKYESNWCHQLNYTLPYGRDKDTFTLLNCGWDGEAWTFPVRNANNEIVGIQRRFKDGFKCMVDGSRWGLFIPQRTVDSSKFVLITEGCSDLITVIDIGFQGVARPNNSACNEMIKNYLDRWCHKSNCFIIADNDKNQAGWKGAIELATLLGLKKTQIFLPPVKDIRQFVEETSGYNVELWIEEQILFHQRKQNEWACM